MQNILITGGTGLIGRHLAKLLEENNYAISILTRTPRRKSPYQEFKWDPAERYIEDEAIKKADYIIHLAGAGIADKRWTSRRKKELYESRISTARLLYEKCLAVSHFPKAFVSAAGTSIYGLDSGGEVQKEDRKNLGSDFLAELCKDWEKAAQQFNKNGVRVVFIRTGMVLAKESGALPQMAWPARFGLSAPLGSGRQYISWIHIYDICRLYLFAVQNNISGVYNAVSPHPVTNKEFMKTLARVYGMPYFLPNVPAFALKMVYGELAETILGGNNVSHEKILKEGFEFSFTNLNSALENLLKQDQSRG